MFDRHPSLEDFAELLDTELASSQAGWIADHLFQCPECWDRATDTVSRLNVSYEALPTGKYSAVTSLVQRFRLEQSRLEEDLVAQAAIGELRNLKRKNQKELIARRRPTRNLQVLGEGQLVGLRLKNR